MRKFKLAYSKRFAIYTCVFALIITTGGIFLKNTYGNESPVLLSNPIKIINLEKEYFNVERQIVEKPEYEIALQIEYQNLIWELSLKNDLSYELILAVLHTESRFDINAINKNKDKSIDGGISQLNSRYINVYKQYAIEFCDLPSDATFDVMNPDHNIRGGIGYLTYLRNYWQARGISEDELIQYVTNSYQLGVDGFERYIRRTGNISRSYDKEVYKRKIMLETMHTFDDAE